LDFISTAGKKHPQTHHGGLLDVLCKPQDMKAGFGKDGGDSIMKTFRAVLKRSKSPKGKKMYVRIAIKKAQHVIRYRRLAKGH